MKILTITTHWTAEEAACVYELLDTFKTAIWQAYGEDIVKMHSDIANEQKQKRETGEFNDELEF
jgi:hypothetical protein